MFFPLIWCIDVQYYGVACVHPFHLDDHCSSGDELICFDVIRFY